LERWCIARFDDARLSSARPLDFALVHSGSMSDFFPFPLFVCSSFLFRHLV